MSRALQKAILVELAERGRLARLIKERWERSPDTADRVRCGVVASYLAERTDAVLSFRFRRKARAAAELGGWSRTVNVKGVPLYLGMREMRRAR